MAKVLLKPSGAVHSSLKRRAYSSLTRRSTSCGSVSGGLFKIASSAVPVYSTYTSISPAARDLQIGVGFDRLRDDLAENRLLGEILGAHGDGARALAEKKIAGADREHEPQRAGAEPFSRRRAHPAAGLERALEPAEREIRAQRDQRRRHRAGENQGIVVGSEAAKNVAPQPAGIDGRR